jgi:hypothetical protein
MMGGILMVYSGVPTKPEIDRENGPYHGSTYKQIIKLSRKTCNSVNLFNSVGHSHISYYFEV